MLLFANRVTSDPGKDTDSAATDRYFGSKAICGLCEPTTALMPFHCNSIGTPIEQFAFERGKKRLVVQTNTWQKLQGSTPDTCMTVSGSTPILSWRKVATSIESTSAAVTSSAGVGIWKKSVALSNRLQQICWRSLQFFP